MQAQTVEHYADLLNYLTPAERRQVERILAGFTPPIWTPLPGPQTMAYDSIADVIGYGGAAGGGKTDLACGKALTQHKRIAIFRREATQLTGIIDRMTDLLGSRDGYNGQDKIWRSAGPNKVQLEFGSVPHLGDEAKHQGRPKDLLVLDEAANFLETQARFLMGWVRTTEKGQRCQTLMTFNPPTTAEGRWVIAFFAPWLDKKHPNPAAPGELRYFATVDGKDVECVSGEPFTHNGELITPQSRTFIPSRITDNPYLVGTGYMTTLQAMPEPLRSQMLYGDFNAGMEDDPWQVIPTAWVEQAMARWKRPDVLPVMDSMGVDVARGGRDETTIARRHGMFFDVPLAYPGTETPDGHHVAGLVVAALRGRARIHIDVIGVGASPCDILKAQDMPVIGVDFRAVAPGSDKSGRLKFANERAYRWWMMRQALDPASNTGIMLPDDSRLLSDLCAPKWLMKSDKIYIESKDEVVKRIGRSPDRGDAYVCALIESPDYPTMINRAARAQRQPASRLASYFPKGAQ